MSSATAIMFAVLSILPTQQGGDRQSIIDTVHNLSASGPGGVRAVGEQQVCIFCHTPHNATAIQPLWNRYLPVAAYTVYSSSSLDALPGQPTGKSKLCLSCHDGTIALGNVASRDQGIAMTGGISTMPLGASNLGTDLSDDHPISFRYDAHLAARDSKLKHPDQLPQGIRLDQNMELQCFSCHDAHDNRHGNFLARDNSNSQLCHSCHQRGDTQGVGHQQCQSCHQMHAAPSGALLLAGETVHDTCITCHDSAGGASGQAPDIAADMNKLSVHETFSSVDLPDAIPQHVGCTDCHEPHTIQSGTVAAPAIAPNFGAIYGVSAAGTAVDRANFEYETCFKCHADQAAIQPWINRQVVQNNTRLEFASTAVSNHAVVTPGKSNSVPSLRPGLTTASVIYCSDCHSSESELAGATSKGTHGSNFRPLLVARYETTDNSRESAAAYALCYRCHERSSILNDESFTGHARHIEKRNTPCSVCHDAHGIASAQGSALNHSHLINFDTTVVSPSRKNGRLEFVDRGFRQGTCTLLCHGKDHDEKQYRP